ncbi:MAG TPA: pyridoxamine 5'-phosphate oxidase family protein, partial [Actinomycetota bacterium]|nr:pyridoxamine 5'-phosphate oxidase family protein [Actinomycetota bacterium]
MPLTARELEEFLAQPRLAHVATLGPRGLRVRPLWYLWREGAFWFTT